MKRLAAVLGVVAVSTGLAPAPAGADSSTDAALALGAFAVFNQLVRGDTVLHDILQPRHVVRETVIVQQPVVVQQPAVVYAPPAVLYAPPPAVVYAPPVQYHYYGHVPRGHLKKHYRHWTRWHD